MMEHERQLEVYAREVVAGNNRVGKDRQQTSSALDDGTPSVLDAPLSSSDGKTYRKDSSIPQTVWKIDYY